MKTDMEILDDVYAHIKNSDLTDKVTGRLLKDHERDMRSLKEDIEIKVLDSEGNEDQDAYVIVNVYVQDNVIDGRYERNDQRVRGLCDACRGDLNVGGIGKDYTFHLVQQRVFAEPETREHKIYNKLLYNNQ